MPMNRSTRLVAAALLAAAFGAGTAHAATEAPYTQAAFVAAQQQDKPILIHVTASWCPVCAKQKPILAKLANDPAYKDLQIFEVDFDTQKELLRTMKVQQQSTFIAYHGTAERTRSTGATDEAVIRGILDRSNG